jgi:hypothetical protein
MSLRGFAFAAVMVTLIFLCFRTWKDVSRGLPKHVDFLKTSSEATGFPVSNVPLASCRRHDGTTAHYLANPLYQTTKLSSVGATFVSHDAGCTLADAPPYETQLNLSVFPMIDIEPEYDCVVATAYFGTLEKTIKPVLHYERSRCAHLCFLGNALMRSSGTKSGWRIIQTPYHLSDPRNPQDGSGHPFQYAKWYKMNTYKLLPKTVRYFFWMDGDTQIINASAADASIKLLQERASIVTLRHPLSKSALAEVLYSETKYTAFSTFHIMASFFFTHIMDGYCEQGTIDSPIPVGSRLSCLIQSAWNCQCPGPKRSPLTSYLVADHIVCNETTVSEMARMSARQFVVANRNQCVYYHSDMKSEVDPARTAGMLYTKIIGFDLAVEDTKRFLDYWYAITYHHWQDQFSVVIAAWRFGVTVSVMPFPGEWVVRVGHGR